MGLERNFVIILKLQSDFTIKFQVRYFLQLQLWIPQTYKNSLLNHFALIHDIEVFGPSHLARSKAAVYKRKDFTLIRKQFYDLFLNHSEAL